MSRFLYIVICLCVAGVAPSAPVEADAVKQLGFSWPRPQKYIVGKAPQGMRVRDGKLYVALAGEDAIGVFRLKNMSLMQKWPMVGAPLDIIALDNDWLVSLYRGSDVITVSRRGGFEMSRQTVGQRPSFFAPRGAHKNALLITEGDGTGHLFDLGSGAVSFQFEIGGQPYPAAIAADGNRAFIPLRETGTVQVFDLAARALLRQKQVCVSLNSVAVTGDGAHVLASCPDDNKIYVLSQLNLDQVAEVNLGLEGGPTALTVDPRGRFAFVAQADDNAVAVVDTTSWQVVHTIMAGPEVAVLRIFDDELFIASEIEGTITRQKIPSEISPAATSTTEKTLSQPPAVRQ